MKSFRFKKLCKIFYFVKPYSHAHHIEKLALEKIFRAELFQEVC